MMRVRFYIDPESGEPHTAGHAVGQKEVREVLARPLEDRAGRDGARVALGQTRAGRYLRVIYVPDPGAESVFVITAYDLGPKGQACASAPAKEEGMKKRSHLPKGWDEARVQRVLKHYDTQSESEAVAEDEAAFEPPTHTAVGVPVSLVPKVRQLIAKHRARNTRMQPPRASTGAAGGRRRARG
jgi:hypothetical protein